MRSPLAWVLVSLTCLTYVTFVLAAPGLETFVMGTDGQSNYSTGGRPYPTSYNFGFGGGVPSNAFTDPGFLAGDGISGLWRDQTSNALAPLSDATNSSGSGNSTWGPWVYSGSTSASARYGQLKSQSQATHTGGSDNMTINNAESFSVFTESLAPTSPGVPNGTAGTMRIAMSLDGNFSVTGTGSAGMVFRYDYGAIRPGYPAINRTLLETFGSIYGNGYSIYGPHSYLGSFTTPAGMTLDIGPLNAQNQPAHITFGGATVVYADIPVTFGSSAEFRMGLQTFTGVGNGNGMMNSLFGGTATLTGIQLFTSQGEITDFSLTSGSGTLYTAQGAVVCPAHVAADFDGDCDVDMDDFGHFQACVTGPFVPYNSLALPPGCTLTPDINGHIAADFDHDGDVDQVDAGIFQRCFSGREVLAQANCAP
jgi:hypothetical protein